MRKSWWYLIMIALIFGVVSWNVGGSRVKDMAPYYFKRIIGETAEVQIKDATFNVELAKTPSSRQKGLSGREYIDKNQGMLFVFPEPGIYQFTMEDTLIPLDIIWILDDRIVFIANKAMPGEEFIDPQKMADYVLEVSVNKAATNNWEVGDTVEITFDKE